MAFHPDPLVESAFDVLSKQSNKGQAQYGGYSSLLERNPSPTALLDDAIEEAADMLLYLLALKHQLAKEK